MTTGSKRSAPPTESGLTLRDVLQLTHDACTSSRPLTPLQRAALAHLRGRYLELRRSVYDLERRSR